MVIDNYRKKMFNKIIKVFVIIMFLLMFTTLDINVRADNEEIDISGYGENKFKGCGGNWCVQQLGYYVYLVDSNNPNTFCKGMKNTYEYDASTFDKLTNLFNTEEKSGNTTLNAIAKSILHKNNVSQQSNPLEYLYINNCDLKFVPKIVSYNTSDSNLNFGEAYSQKKLNSWRIGSIKQGFKYFIDYGYEYWGYNYPTVGVNEPIEAVTSIAVDENYKSRCVKKSGLVADALSDTTCFSRENDSTGFYDKYYGLVSINKYFSKLRIIKVDSSDSTEKLKGVRFKIFRNSSCSGSPIKETTTDSTGEINLNLEISGYYSIWEESTIDGYELPNDRCVAYNIQLEKNKTKTITIKNKKKNKPKLQIKKVTKDSTGKLIPVGSISATFNIYEDDKCRGTSLGSLTTKKLSGISEERELDEGIYYIKETNISPSNSGYEISNECKKVDLTGQNGTVTVNYENPQTCPSELYELKLLGYPQNNLEYRKRLFELYNKYGKKGLLNFNDPSCGNPTCNRNASFMCLNAEYETQTPFDEGNISCFNTEFEYQSHKVYCLDTFQLTNPLGAPKTWNVKAGQMVINKLDRIAATGTVVRKCYFVAGNSSGYNPGKYSDYVSNLKFNGDLLTFSISTLKQTISGNYYSEYSASTDYLLNPVFARISDGYISSKPGNNYNLLGYGIISKFNDKTKYEIPFSITLGNMFKDHKGTREYSTNNPYRCYVNPELEIIKNDKLNLEFRIIDTNNAFPGKSGSNNRIVGTNWRSKNLNINKKELEDNITDAKLIDSGLLRKYDLNKDGKIDESDMNFLNWYNNLANQTNKVKYSKNLYIKYIMENTNNSYNKNKAKPIYSIKLTPSTIKKIRDYNKNNKYDDFTLVLKKGKWIINDTFYKKTGVTIV